MESRVAVRKRTGLSISFEAVEPRPRIGHPVELAVLAVADDVDAGVDLLADHLVDGALHPRRERGLVVGLAQLLGVQHRDQIGRPRQAAGVGGQDAARAALHSNSRCASGGLSRRRHIAIKLLGTSVNYRRRVGQDTGVHPMRRRDVLTLAGAVAAGGLWPARIFAQGDVGELAERDGHARLAVHAGRDERRAGPRARRKALARCSAAVSSSRIAPVPAARSAPRRSRARRRTGTRSWSVTSASSRSIRASTPICSTSR